MKNHLMRRPFFFAIILPMSIYYAILFAIAPAVARFYGLPILQPMLRVKLIMLFSTSL